MTLGELITRVQQQLPEATGEQLDPQTVITPVLNHGVDEINLIVQAYQGYQLVPNVANQQFYSLSAICPGYLSILKPGVKWFAENDAQASTQYLYRKTRMWFDLWIPNWFNQDPVVNPTWYFIEGDQLGFVPASSSTSNFGVHYLSKAMPMDNNSNYPWNNQPTELTTFRCFDNAIVAYAVWKLAPAVRDNWSRNTNELDFYKEIKKASAQFKRRGDMTSDWGYYIRPDFQNGFLPR